MAQSVAILDYGMGNLHSVRSALELVAPDQQVDITSDPARVARADRVIFPGVGAIRDCMAEIRRLGLDQLLRQQVAERKPVLGICVGMQALMDHSEENGGVDCIGLLPGQVKFFGDLRDSDGQALKVPHMGWNQVDHQDHPLWHQVPPRARFYFVHSYYIHSAEPAWVSAHCDYGLRFHAALARDNLFAVQFHPEKSHTAGLQLLKNFLHWNGQP